MRKIAIALILFQLIGCAKQPAIVTNQNEINRLKAEIEGMKKRYGSEIFWNRVGAAVGIGIGVLAIIASVVIAKNNHKKIEQLKQKVDNSRIIATAKSMKAIDQRVKGTETNIIKIEQEQNELKDVIGEQLNELKDAQKNSTEDILALQNEKKDLQEGQKVLEEQFRDHQNAVSLALNTLSEAQKGLRCLRYEVKKLSATQKALAAEQEALSALSNGIEDVNKKIPALDALSLSVTQTGRRLSEVTAAYQELVETQNSLVDGFNALSTDQNTLRDKQRTLEATQDTFYQTLRDLGEKQITFQLEQKSLNGALENAQNALADDFEALQNELKKMQGPLEVKNEPEEDDKEPEEDDKEPEEDNKD